MSVVLIRDLKIVEFNILYDHNSFRTLLRFLEETNKKNKPHARVWQLLMT